MKMEFVVFRFDDPCLRDHLETFIKVLQRKSPDEIEGRFRVTKLSEKDIKQFADVEAENNLELEGGQYKIGKQDVSREVYEEYLRRDCRLLVIETEDNKDENARE